MSSQPQAKASASFSRALGRARQWLRQARRYLRGLLGADAYERYLEFEAASAHTHAPLTEAEFWRERMDRQERNPQGRCC